MVRFRNRYFLCEIISEDPRCPQFIEERIVHNAVKNAVARMHGDFGAACCSNAFSGIVSWVLLVHKALGNGAGREREAETGLSVSPQMESPQPPGLEVADEEEEEQLGPVLDVQKAEENSGNLWAGPWDGRATAASKAPP
uniref:Uncharacterized protein n=1 Tax=Pseudonaja textilis TaxID=8673 RepID=A0A670Z4Y0_PSETE